jgi:hypothetical protein
VFVQLGKETLTIVAHGPGVFLSLQVLLSPLFGGQAGHAHVDAQLPWQPVGILLSEPLLHLDDLGPQFDDLYIVVRVFPLDSPGTLQDRIDCCLAGHEVQLRDGRIERPLAATQKEDRDPRPAIVGQNVP